uniref:BHLH transcription factor n=1 Tax=Dracaena cambodiana TaxID=580341 RepID=A0A7M3UQL6_9ASPA|nr:bHLH transcription factor [Dracaena cambodiana]
MLSSPSSSSPSQSSSSKTRNPKPETRKQSRWKTPTQQRLYNRRLIDALRSPNPPPASARAIKDAADSALALTARGQTRWSRAILTSRRRKVILKVRRKRPKKPAKKMLAGADKLNISEPAKDRKVNERLRKLGRLVPGCRKLSAPSLLEEAADYVAALEVQVKAMRALAEAMAAAALTGPAAEAAAAEEEASS